MPWLSPWEVVPLTKLYRSLAKRSFKNNGRIYLPFIFVALMMLSFSIILHDMAFNSAYKSVAYMETLQMVLQMGYYILQIFNFLFLYYTYSYLLRMRSKELALYQVLGLSKKNLLAVITWENIYLFFFICGLGALLGSLGNYLIQGLFVRFTGIQEEISWSIQKESYGINGISYLILFLLLEVRAMVRIYKQNPLSYLKESKRRQSSKGLKGIYTLVGVVCLSIGYFIALQIKNPVDSLVYFFIAALFVVLGTYCFFLGILDIFLKFLQGRKSFYYEKNRMTAISGLLFRLRDQAMSLGSITVLITAVLVLLSCALSLNQSVEALVDTTVPLDLVYKTRFADQNQAKKNFDDLLAPSQSVLKRNKGKVKKVIQLRGIDGEIDLNRPEKGFSSVDWNDKNSMYVRILPQREVNQLLHTSYDLKDGEGLVLGRESSLEENLDLSFLGVHRQEKKVNENLGGYYDLKQVDLIQKLVFVVVNDSSFNRLEGQVEEASLTTISHFALKDKKDEKALKGELLKEGEGLQKNLISSATGRQEIEEAGRGLYGGLTFTGLSLGIIFLIALGATIYYKQLTEGYEDRRSFVIYRQVGMDEKTVKKSIKTQVSLVFFLPVALSFVHMIFAYQLLSRMMSLLNVGNTIIYLKATLMVVILVLVLYFIWYKITGSVYYNLIGKKNKGLLF